MPNRDIAFLPANNGDALPWCVNETYWEDHAIFDKVCVIVAVSLCAMSLPTTAQERPPLPISKTTSTWVERSNAYAQILIRAEDLQRERHAQVRRGQAVRVR